MGKFPVALMSVCIALSCAKSVHTVARSDSKQMEKIRKIGILRFTNFTASPDAGRIVSSQISREWVQKKGRFELVDFETSERLLSEKYVLQPETTDRAKGAELGSILGCDAVMIGSVFEYGTIPLVRRQKIVREPAVGIRAQLVRVEDGVVLWSEIVTKTSEALVVPSGKTAEDLSAEVVAGMISGVMSRKADAKTKP